MSISRLDVYGKLPKNRNFLKLKTNHFCFDDEQRFLTPHTKFKTRFIFDPISNGWKLQRRTLSVQAIFIIFTYIREQC